jgi:RecA/RadA recombinase
MSSALIDKIKKNSTIKETEVLSEQTLLHDKDSISTPVPMLNVALSGRVDGGIIPGLTVLAGPSKHFKSLFALVIGAAFLNKYPEGILLFYDSEFGTPTKYFENLGMDMDRIVHTPITNIEELKHDLTSQLEGISRKDKICIIVDSVGNLASKKEVEDAKDGKSVADMSRAKAMKSLFRIVTPYLTVKDVPLITINHTYKTMEMFSKDVVSGGTGIYYSAGDIWIIGRQQDKDDKTKKIEGYHFIINIEKSRLVREKMKIPISVSYDHGINRWSGLLENALEAGIIVKPIAGRYERVDGNFSGKRFTESEILNHDELWKDILSNTDLPDYIKNKYSGSGSGNLIQNGEDSDDVHSD